MDKFAVFTLHSETQKTLQLWNYALAKNMGQTAILINNKSIH